MSDRKLLDMAAKAHGDLKYDPFRYAYRHTLIMGFLGAEWYPLADDGDAFRLAEKLGFSVNFHKGLTTVYGDFPNRDFVTDECPRRAIVTAAAEIGRGLK